MNISQSHMNNFYKIQPQIYTELPDFSLENPGIRLEAYNM